MERERERENMKYFHKDKYLSTSQLFFIFINLSLVTNTASTNASKKNTNNYDKITYDLNTKQKAVTV